MTVARLYKYLGGKVMRNFDGTARAADCEGVRPCNNCTDRGTSAYDGVSITFSGITDRTCNVAESGSGSTTFRTSGFSGLNGTHILNAVDLGCLPLLDSYAVDLGNVTMEIENYYHVSGITKTTTCTLRAYVERISGLTNGALQIGIYSLYTPSGGTPCKAFMMALQSPELNWPCAPIGGTNEFGVSCTRKMTGCGPTGNFGGNAVYDGHCLANAYNPGGNNNATRIHWCDCSPFASASVSVTWF